MELLKAQVSDGLRAKDGASDYSQHGEPRAAEDTF